MNLSKAQKYQISGVVCPYRMRPSWLILRELGKDCDVVGEELAGHAIAQRALYAIALMLFVCNVADVNMVYCQAYGCTNTTNTGGKKPGVSFHAFPDPAKRPEICRKWIAALKIEKFDPKNYKHSRSNVVCSKHFAEDDFVVDLQAKLLGTKPKNRLKEDAVPSIFEHRPAPKRRRTSENREAKMAARKYLQSVLEEPPMEEPALGEPVSVSRATRSTIFQELDTGLVGLGHPSLHDEPAEPMDDKSLHELDTGLVGLGHPSLHDEHADSLDDKSLHAKSHGQHLKMRRRRKRKKTASDKERYHDKTAELMKVDASCQTFHSGANVMMDKDTQCPEDFTYLNEEHKYAHESPQLLKPVIAFSAVSQSFSTQVYIHHTPPEVTAHSPQPAPVTPSSSSSLSSMPSHVSPYEQQLSINPTTQSIPTTPPNQPCVDTPCSSDPPSQSPCKPQPSSPDTSGSEVNDSSSVLSSGSSYEMSEDESSSSDSDNEPDELRFCKDKKYIVFESQLNRLLYSLPCNACANGHIAELQKQCVGTMLKVTVICVCGNIVNKWMSQPTIGRQPVGNILFSGALLLSGSTYEKVSFFCELLNLQPLSSKTFHEVQRDMLLPVINTYYQQEIREQQQHVTGRPVTVCGDGRCDSPGFSAKFCTYTTMHMDTNKILAMALVSVQEATSSVGMEKIGCRRAIDELLAAGVEVDVLATDRHVSIRKMLKDDYPAINHQFDVWHLAKSVTKKLTAKSKQKEHQDLGPWIKAISNHIWWSAQNCREDPIMLVEMVQSMTHHICGIHSWNSSDKFHRCAHGDLTVEKQESTKWLKPGSKSHEALQTVLFDKRLVNDLKQLSKSCHTGALEVFHNLYLKYCPKRQHFFYPSMLARSQLSVLDHNTNTGRKQATVKKTRKGSDKKGAVRYKYAYSKATKAWIVRKVPEDKDYVYLWDILVATLQMKSGTFDSEAAVIPDLPQNIAPVPRPSREDLLAHATSRFAK